MEGEQKKEVVREKKGRTTGKERQVKGKKSEDKEIGRRSSQLVPKEMEGELKNKVTRGKGEENGG